MTPLIVAAAEAAVTDGLPWGQIVLAVLAAAPAVVGAILFLRRNKDNNKTKRLQTKSAIDARIDARVDKKLEHLETVNAALVEKNQKFATAVSQWWQRLFVWDKLGRQGAMPMPSEDERKLLQLEDFSNLAPDSKSPGDLVD